MAISQYVRDLLPKFDDVQLEIIERNAEKARDISNRGMTDNGFPNSIEYESWERTTSYIRDAWRRLIAETFEASGFFVMLEALENLENDAAQIEANAWRMVQEAIRHARTLEPQGDFTFGEVLGGVQRRADEIPW